MKYKKSSFNNQEVLLDNNEFHQCSFKDCTLTYGGDDPPILSGCSFSGVKWSFVGAAANTISFMTGIYNGCGEGGRGLIEKTFDNIRGNVSPTRATLH